MTAINSCSLRPISEADLERVRGWRNSDRIRALMYSDNVISSEEQKRWFDGLKNDPSRVYLIFEVNKEPVGVVCFNPIDAANGTATWGFYLGDPAAPRGAGRRMGESALDYAFDTLGLRMIFAETFAFNERGVRFHDQLGFARAGSENSVRLKNGEPRQIVKFSLDRDAWAARRRKAGTGPESDA